MKRSVLLPLALLILATACGKSKDKSAVNPTTIDTKDIDAIPLATDGTLLTSGSVQTVAAAELETCNEANQGHVFRIDDEDSSAFHYCSYSFDRKIGYLRHTLSKDYIGRAIKTQRTAFVTILDKNKKLVDVVSIDLYTIDSANPYVISCQGIHYGSSNLNSHDPLAGEVCEGLESFSTEPKGKIPGRFILSGSYTEPTLYYISGENTRIKLNFLAPIGA